MKKNLISPFKSRQYMLQKDFELYYYNDTHMKPVADHAHDYYEFYFYLEGKVSINIDGMGHVLRAGDIIVIPPKTVHHMDILNPNVPYRRFVFWVSCSFMDHLRERTADYAYIAERAEDRRLFITNFDPAAFSAFENRIFRLLEEIHARRFGRDEYILLAVDELILALSRAAYTKDTPAGKTEELTLSEKLIDYIDGHLEEDLSLELLSQKFFVSRYHIAHTFTDTFGVSLHRYVQKKRLEKSRHLIMSGIPATSAFLQCGFTDYSSFYRAFKAEFGISPKECRM